MNRHKQSGVALLLVVASIAILSIVLQNFQCVVDYIFRRVLIYAT